MIKEIFDQIYGFMNQIDQEKNIIIFLFNYCKLILTISNIFYHLNKSYLTSFMKYQKSVNPW